LQKQTGVNAMILKNVFADRIGVKIGVFLLIKYSYLGRKLAKSAENNGHNIDPWFAQPFIGIPVNQVWKCESVELFITMSVKLVSCI
jgi:hypothetical protein